eukprot:gene18550-biopygen8409
MRPWHELRGWSAVRGRRQGEWQGEQDSGAGVARAWRWYRAWRAIGYKPARQRRRRGAARGLGAKENGRDKRQQTRTGCGPCLSTQSSDVKWTRSTPDRRFTQTGAAAAAARCCGTARRGDCRAAPRGAPGTKENGRPAQQRGKEGEWQTGAARSGGVARGLRSSAARRQPERAEHTGPHVGTAVSPIHRPARHGRAMWRRGAAPGLPSSAAREGGSAALPVPAPQRGVQCLRGIFRFFANCEGTITLFPYACVILIMLSAFCTIFPQVVSPRAVPRRPSHMARPAER